MKKISLFFFFLFLNNFLYANEKVVYLDVNFLLTESEVGKYVNSNLKKITDDNNELFKSLEKELKLDEEKLLAQQNILKKEDYDKKLSELRNKFKLYQDKKNSKNKELNLLRNNAGNTILKNINEIMTEYSKKNSISLVIQKQSIIIGKTELDVTNNILELLNKKITKLELK
tara:strand:+ start:8494 stop:9009 length:516 start_codon:yes stop_codon:yes gene_type:complete